MKDFCGHFMWKNDFKYKLTWLTNNEQKIKPNIKDNRYLLNFL